MPKQVQSQDIMPLLDKMSDEQIELASDELHNFVLYRRTAEVPRHQRAPFPVADFFKNFVKVVQAVWPVIQPLIDGQQGTQPQQGNP